MPASVIQPFDSWLGPLEERVRSRLESLAASDFTTRLWRRDPALWKKDDTHQKVARSRLGWLGSVGPMQAAAADLRAFAAEALADGLRSAVLLGMGGSSLCPEVFARVFGPADRGMGLLVLDSTDPGAIEGVQRRIDEKRTIFLVSSKSGSTIETLSLYEHFRERLASAHVEEAGRRFVAITDPGSPLQQLSREKGFRRCFANPADIGGRYSALSYFGAVPAALLGLDLDRLLGRASRMAAACGPSAGPGANPGVRLGAILGEAALAGRDKLTLLLSPEIAPFGAWLEQLIAESTGKEGRGILPVEGEAPGRPALYGGDRIFVWLRLPGGRNEELDASAAALREASHPIVRIDLEDAYDLGGEIFRWEIATAVAGAILDVDPFDEPNVKESKDNTSRILAEVESGGRPDPGEPLFAGEALEIHAAGSAAAGLRAEIQRRRWPTGAAAWAAALLAGARAPSYLALQAWIPMSPGSDEVIGGIRTSLRDALGVAVTTGYGPRFLHSTGQYHKGGPPQGVFLQVTAEPPRDLPIPGRPWSFATLEAAQARGDLEALAARGRPALRVHLRQEAARGLPALRRLISEALGLLASGRA